jgi:ADP-heptose:LPS heptosyltransferase
VNLTAQRALARARDAGKHMVWGFGALLRVEIDDPRYEYVVDPAEEAWAQRKLREFRGPVVLIARHSTSCKSNSSPDAAPNKCFSNGIWIKVAERLAGEGIVPVAIGGSSDLGDRRYADWPGPKIYGENIRNVAALCRASHGVLTVDSGIRHIAAAAGADMLCISGHVPLSFIHCEPVRERQVVRERYRALSQVTEDYVLAEVDAFLRSKAETVGN